MASFRTEATLYLGRPGGERHRVAVSVDPGYLQIEAHGDLIGRWSTGEASITDQENMLLVHAEGEKLFLETGLKEAIVSTFYDNAHHEPLTNPAEGTAHDPGTRADWLNTTFGGNSRLAGWLRLAAVAAFVLPFMTVSCTGQDIGTATGVHLALGLQADVDESMSDPELGGQWTEAFGSDLDEGRVEIEWPLSVAAALLIGATISSFISAPRWLPSSASSVALLLLLYWWFDLSGQVEPLAMFELELRPRFGLWIVGGAASASLVADAVLGRGVHKSSGVGRDLITGRSPRSVATRNLAPIVLVVATIVGGSTGGWYLLSQRSVTCDEWIENWEADAARFSAALSEWSQYLGSTQMNLGVLEDYADRLERIRNDAAANPAPPSDFAATELSLLGGMDLVVDGAREIATGVAGSDARVVDLGTATMVRGQDQIRAAATTAPPCIG